MVIVPPPGLPTKKVLNTLNQKPCPEGITIKQVVKRQNHVDLTAANAEQSERLKTHMKEMIPDAKIEDKRSPTIRIIFHNASVHKEDTLLNVLIDHGFDKSEIRFVTELRSKNENIRHWVLELPKAKTNSTLLKNYHADRPSFILIGLQRLYFKIYVRLMRCQRCQSLDHSTRQCDGPAFCVQCSQEHFLENCTDSPLCINCSEFNNDVNEGTQPGPKRNAYHPASASSCPTYKAKLQELIHPPQSSETIPKHIPAPEN